MPEARLQPIDIGRKDLWVLAGSGTKFDACQEPDEDVNYIYHNVANDRQSFGCQTYATAGITVLAVNSMKVGYRAFRSFATNRLRSASEGTTQTHFVTLRSLTLLTHG